MALETLDRTLWSFSTALAHVERVTVTERARSWQRGILGDHATVRVAVSDLPGSVVKMARRGARDGLLIALRDGYLRATGRRSNTPALFAASASDGQWRLHATDPGLITTTEWREGEFNFTRGALTSPAWDYIDIEVPAFMVMTVWPEFVPEAAWPAQDDRTATYTTPYLDLMQAAIAHFGLTAENQDKKDCLLDWFLTQQVEGEPVSRNLADAMATLIRLPSAQRGGAKRVMGPDLRQAG